MHPVMDEEVNSLAGERDQRLGLPTRNYGVVRKDFPDAYGCALY